MEERLSPKQVPLVRCQPHPLMDTQKPIIGIIGGMGPQASIELYRLLIERARHVYGARNNDDYPEILIDSIPVPDFLSDTQKMNEANILLEDRVRRLAQFGTSYITMACNTACLLYDTLQKQTKIPMISIVDEVVRSLSQTSGKVLLLASPTSLRYGLYQVAFAKHGISYEVPKKKDFKEIEYIIRGVIEEKEREMLMKKITRLTERYIDNNDIEGIVLGCTELPLVFPTNYRLPVYSSLIILAETLLKQYYRKVSVA